MAARKTKTEVEVRKEIMKKEWSMSKCTPLSLERLVRIGVLHAQELARWRAPDLELFPDPKGDEIVVFEEYFTHGFGVPVHPFLQGLCNYYEISICNLHLNSVLLVACFIHLYEAYGGFQPHFDYFHHLFWLKKKGGRGGSNVAGGCYLNMRKGIRAEYLHCPWKTTLEDWYRHWFYIHEEPSQASYCDVSLVPEKTNSWKELPQNTI
jgi:hypothetical protein